MPYMACNKNALEIPWYEAVTYPFIEVYIRENSKHVVRD
jgi:hypothetical protein